MPEPVNRDDVPTQRSCPCGSGLCLGDCCLPLISGRAAAVSALALMRSRYTAYVLGRVDYLSASWHPATRPQQLELGGNIEWLGLEVLSCKAGLEGDTKGSVEFVARYQQQDRKGQAHENSRFVREQGVWLYLDGDLKTAAVTGRNDPCTCGSGKKFKKCCGRQLIV